MALNGRLRFGVIGVDHVHAFLQSEHLLAAGAEFAGWAGPDSPITAEFSDRFPFVPRMHEVERLLGDPSIDLIVTAAIPDRRAAIAIQALNHRKHVLTDKPGAVTLEQLGQIEAARDEAGLRWVVFFSERHASPATEEALRRVREGAIGDVVNTIGTGPHRLGLTPRPPWFFDRSRSGGILADLASHQIDQFLAFTGAKTATIVRAHRANRATPAHPAFDDVGEILLETPGATGYARVDWLTPDGLETWGDVRLFVQGTAGAIEIRKNVDLAGAPGPEHLFVVDADRTERATLADRPSTFAHALVRDLANGTEDAGTQRHCLEVTRLALEAEARATRQGTSPSNAPDA